MGIPAKSIAARYYRAAKHRFEEAELLLEHKKTTAAVYLAGYGVECILKALLFQRTPESKHESIRLSFRGVQGHNLEWLHDQLRKLGIVIPATVMIAFRKAASWNTELRYETQTIKLKDSEVFLSSAKLFIEWADRSI